MTHVLIFPILAFLLVAALIPVARRLALARDFVDRPGGRKVHEKAVPPVGGLVLFPVFMAVAWWHGLDRPEYWCLGALLILLIAGALDDRFSLPPRVKFAAQWLAALLLVRPGDAALHDLGNLLGFGDVTFGLVGGMVFAAVACVLLINAINLMDGLDGLAGGVGFVALFWLAVCGIAAGQAPAMALPLILMGALAGFLLYNLRNPLRRRACVFLGDAGSLTLGLALGWFCIRYSQGTHQVIRPAAVAWLLALPIYDCCGQFARRVAQGRHPFSADQEHFHHHFLYIGLRPGHATATILALAFLLGAVGVGGSWLGVPDWVLGWLWTLLLLAHIYLSMRPRRFRRLLMKIRGSSGA